jgi:hypothetical protein
MERSGTHALAAFLGAAALDASVGHETPPLLANEAMQAAGGPALRTPDTTAWTTAMLERSTSHQLVVEANHRLGFLVASLVPALGGDTRLVFLVRDPVEYSVSKVLTLAHWPSVRRQLPGWYQAEIDRWVPSEKRELNRWRIRPPWPVAPFWQLHAWEWAASIVAFRAQVAAGLDRERVLVIPTSALSDSWRLVVHHLGHERFRPLADVDLTVTDDASASASASPERRRFAVDQIRLNADAIYDLAATTVGRAGAAVLRPGALLRRALEGGSLRDLVLDGRLG